ncbi:NAD(P)-binding domain-containing protein [Gynuella sunshinyii]|uniref:Putative flavoprotein involved in K+ transport n=1 Tax=Gynuella sunshinyii YC6258 TaxID=1445510 RepID=A0A0C5W2C8_9GAMM|nr:NAD(P)-binding domain-containing protein [Gynuella sunshinyii]AJQ96824.1 putative flavoprotein involved in K+ transport [Gynuella sunshinyii YC6258]
MIKDYIIIGAGPAGLQLGYLMQQSSADYLILESGSGVGSFFKQYPRHRQLISINKKYTGDTDLERNLRSDWNSLLNNHNLQFPDYSSRYFPSADTFVTYLEDFHQQHQINVLFDQTVDRIEKTDVFTIHCSNGQTYQCRALIVATGVSQENVPDIPGIELCERYSNTIIEPMDYVNQRVLIIGKGNSAFETADNLIETTAYIHVAGRSSIRLAWQTHYVGHLRAVNNNLLDTYQLKSQNAILDGEVVSVEKLDNEYKVIFSFSRSNEVHKTLYYDRVICCTGFRFNADIFATSCRPNMTIHDRFPEMNSQWESVNVPDLYFAGTLMQQRDFKKSTCGFVHGFRYAVRSLFHILNLRYQNLPLPTHTLPLNATLLASFIAERINRTSALWQQFEFMCDSVLLDQQGCHYIEELPVAFCHDTFGRESKNYISIALEYGPDHDKVDPFNIDINRVSQDDHENALNAQYLHPVLRFYYQGKHVSTHHMAENLENEWNRYESHVIPLQQYLSSCLQLVTGTEVPDTAEA